MPDIITPLRGMKDLLPEDYDIHKYIEELARKTAELYGYQGFATPILESATVFDRTLGDTSDVVSKEMYSFQDKKGRFVAMRPEFTASIMRAFVSNGLKQKIPLKLFSCGPLFRYDRPQEGRQRQFHQLNFEHLGASGPYSDAETIRLAVHVLENLGILSDIKLELNSLGCSDSRERYNQVLIDYFTKYFDDLSEDSKQRLHKNPLRIMDSKDKNDQKLAANAPTNSEFYTKEAAEYFDNVKMHLDNLDIQYTESPRLARGLDYYCHTTFEFTTDKLGAQSTVLAGGRYDGLCEIMGGPSMPAIGFAAGIERIRLMRDFAPQKNRSVIVIPIGQESHTKSMKLTNILRENNIQTSLELKGKVGKLLQAASANNASHVIFIGEDELKNNNYKIKDLDSEAESWLGLDELINLLRNK